MNKNKGFNNINNGFYTANENNSNSLVGQLTNRLSIREVVNILKSINVKGLSDNKLNELAEKLKKELELAYPRGKPSPLRIRELLKLKQINQNKNNLRKTHKALKKEKKNRKNKMLFDAGRDRINMMINDVERRAEEKRLKQRNLGKLGKAETRVLPIDARTNLTGGSKKKRTKRTKRKTTKKKTRKPKVHTGPRGGKYIMRKGKKVYV